MKKIVVNRLIFKIFGASTKPHFAILLSFLVVIVNLVPLIYYFEIPAGTATSDTNLTIFRLFFPGLTRLRGLKEKQKVSI